LFLFAAYSKRNDKKRISLHLILANVIKYSMSYSKTVTLKKIILFHLPTNLNVVLIVSGIILSLMPLMSVMRFDDRSNWPLTRDN
jgi:hypothetical protein